MNAPLLEVEDLRVTYRVGHRKVEAVKGVSFSVARGRCLGVVGESGSGKSSLARAVLALEDGV
ncbi:MAG: ATP-binding cassette domain-containing protein, partial [Spartobacteria bacterium]|nr:ATP-binding cassette domain-containing protein [Spartobacteria bacterium]